MIGAITILATLGVLWAIVKGGSSEDQPTPLDDNYQRMKQQIKKEGYHV